MYSINGKTYNTLREVATDLGIGKTSARKLVKNGTIKVIK